MGRVRSRRGLIEDSSRITIKELRDWGYLREGSTKGVMTMTRGNWTATFEVEVIINTLRSAFFFIYSYEANGIRVTDWSRLEKVSLKYGDRYFFRCLATGQRVSAIYFVNGRFGSRHAHDLAYRACKEHRQWYENQRRFERYYAKWNHQVWDYPMYLRRSYLRSGLEMAYEEKVLKYGNLMAEDFDRRFSKVLERIRRNGEARKSPSSSLREPSRACSIQ
jgi:hypothetical protein